jgi:hypothetical protein
VPVGATFLAAIAAVNDAFDDVDGSPTGTRVPKTWALLKLPRFGGVKHASDHDNRSRYREVSFLGPRL